MVKGFWLPTGLLAAVLLIASIAFGAAATANPMPAKNAAPANSLVAQGQALTVQYHCTGCHGADLMGKPGKTPNLHQSGILKSYNEAQLAKVLSVGITCRGTHLIKMPVLNVPAPQSNAIYAYLKTLK